jgi:hypothetical protein
MAEYRDRDTVVVSDRSSGLGTILGVLLVIALLVAVWYFTLGPGRGTVDQNSGGNSQPLPSVEASLPASVAPSVAPSQ